MRRVAARGFLALLIVGCGETQATVPVHGYQVVQTFPHDPSAYCQGLLFEGGKLYESTGLVSRSTVRRVVLETGDVELAARLPGRLFGEGLTMCDGELIQLTWHAGQALGVCATDRVLRTDPANSAGKAPKTLALPVRYVGLRQRSPQSSQGLTAIRDPWRRLLVLDLESFRMLRTFHYSSEGWGIATDGTELIMSDGSSFLTFRDPKTFDAVRRVQVTLLGVPVDQLNELEWAEGEVSANCWKRDHIARIDSESGEIVGRIDLHGIFERKLDRE